MLQRNNSVSELDLNTAVKLEIRLENYAVTSSLRLHIDEWDKIKYGIVVQGLGRIYCQYGKNW